MTRREHGADRGELLYEMLCVLPGVPQNPSRFSGLTF
jgi:hypothetical protein